MSATIMEGRLLAALTSDPVIAQRSGTAHASPDGGIAIERRGHHVGLWRWSSGSFALLPAGFGEPVVEMDTIAEAVQVTIQRFFQK